MLMSKKTGENMLASDITKKWMKLGNISSIIAGIIIEFLLYKIYIENDITIIFKDINLVLLLLLFPIGLGAYLGYTRSTQKALKTMKYISPIALALAGIGVFGAASNALTQLQGVYLIVAAYFVELVVGIPLSLDFKYIDKFGSLLFSAGVTIFVLSLPSVIYNPQFSIISLIGNTIKILGLSFLLIKI